MLNSGYKKDLEMNKKEKYELNLKDLMDLIPVSTIAKQVDNFKDEDDGKVLDHQIKWVVGDHVVYSGIRDVYLIYPNDSEVFKFILKRADYKNFVVACEARRKELFQKTK